MGGYIANFTVYTMAMLGLIFFALFVYKKFMNGGLGAGSSKFLCVEETMNINPRKSLMVVRAGNEKFLIASDVDRTTLLSKLNDSKAVADLEKYEHFHKIEKENYYEKIIPQRKMPQNRIVDSNIVDDIKPKIHLEPITEKNHTGTNLRRGMDRRESYKNHQHKQNVVLDFDKFESKQSLTTIREMAKKINEL